MRACQRTHAPRCTGSGRSGRVVAPRWVYDKRRGRRVTGVGDAGGSGGGSTQKAVGTFFSKATLFVKSKMYLKMPIVPLQWGRSLGSCGNSPRFSHHRNSQLRALLREPTFGVLAELNQSIVRDYREVYKYLE